MQATDGLASTTTSTAHILSCTLSSSTSVFIQIQISIASFAYYFTTLLQLGRYCMHVTTSPGTHIAESAEPHLFQSGAHLLTSPQVTIQPSFVIGPNLSRKQDGTSIKTLRSVAHYTCYLHGSLQKLRSILSACCRQQDAEWELKLSATLQHAEANSKSLTGLPG